MSPPPPALAETAIAVAPVRNSGSCCNNNNNNNNNNSKDRGKPKKGEFKHDPRHPLYLGTWTRSIPSKDAGPTVDDLDEPHLKRKWAILKDHPEIEELYGHDASTLTVAIVSNAVQIALASLFSNVLAGWNVALVVTAYVLGGSLTSLQGVLIHEATHNLVGQSTVFNRWVGNLSNVILLVPIAQSFRRYHLEHHTYQGVEDYDPDLPLKWEIGIIRNNPVFKFIWLFIYGIIYISRGLAMGRKLSRWELYNWAWTGLCDVILYRVVGGRGMVYLALSVLFGYGFHPGAAHFIQEHYTFHNGQETYSYYGLGNYFWLNIGYHNEHHDFVKVPWSKLPEVRKIASEYYDSLAYHMSWWGVLLGFITNRLMAPQSRLVRSIYDHSYARKYYKVPSPEARQRMLETEEQLLP
ncbi:sphingolipid delta-4 desaturase [Spiromyces aspiralis]|uniref:Sphingolipid delta-4 desaturase n=1 Tax=Spiromyces aspiralis TaxID=68401 RepID=A0ACC1I240_9FUNG|nr:sphingolipid delta-4 desaturase [Spiromyces aspiralis]